MPISYDYYIYLLSLGIPYEGEVEMPDGTLLYSVRDVQVLAPEHQDIYNPPRFAETGNFFVLLRQCTLILPPQQKKQEIDTEKTGQRLYNKIVRRNNNGTTTVNMGFGEEIDVPTHASDIKIEVISNEYYMGAETATFSISVTDYTTQSRHYKKMKLADADVVFSNNFSPNADDSSLAQTLQSGLTLGGLILTLGELSAGIATFRTHRMGGTKFSPKLYRSGWTGGSRGGIKTHSAAKVLRVVGRAVFIAGIIIELELFRKDIQTLGKSTANIVFGGIATFGSIPGLLIGIAYFGLDALGVFDGPDYPYLPIEQQMQRFDIDEYNRVRQDKTRITMPHRMYEINKLPVLDSTQIQKLLLDK